MNNWTDRRTDLWLDKKMDGQTDGWTVDEPMDAFPTCPVGISVLQARTPVTSDSGTLNCTLGQTEYGSGLREKKKF